MASSCAELTDGQTGLDCKNLPPGGTEAEVTVLNYGDVVEVNETVDGVIDEIILAAGKRGFVFEGFRNDVKKTEEVIIPDVGVQMFKHGSGFVVYRRDQLTKNQIEALCRGKFMLVIKNKGKDATTFELVGKGVGVSIVAGVIKDAHANGGFYVLTFATADGDGELEPRLPQTIFDTDYETTQALVDALSNAGS